MCKTDKDLPIWKIKKAEAQARKAAAASAESKKEKAFCNLSVKNIEYFKENMEILSTSLSEISAATSRASSAISHILGQLYYTPTE